MLLITLVIGSCIPQPEKVSLIPLPEKMEIRSGDFCLNSNTVIVASGEALETAQYLQLFLQQHTGLNLAIEEQGKTNAIILSLGGQLTNPEAYHFESDKNSISISAPEPAGLFYGVQTFRQLLPAQIEKASPSSGIKWTIPAVIIDDQPSFQWRGFMLDCCRHYFEPEFIKKVIDQMALRKMNVFHWHLIDAQGFRMEIKKYPKLHEISAWRVQRDVMDWFVLQPQQPGEKATYGGYYTQEQIKDMVEYARRRNITIVPEIEMPSHITCVFAAYPQFSCSGKRITVPPSFAPQTNLFSTMPWLNISPDERMDDLYCAGNDSTFIFLEDILNEVMDLFPSKYINVGCDEVNPRAWQICQKCQARIKNEGLKDTDGLFGYFVGRIQKILNARDRTLISWNQKLHGVDSTSLVMMHNWDLSAVRKGHPVVMAPTTHCYFDCAQGPRNMEPFASGGPAITLDTVYSFYPVSPELNSEEAKSVLGGEAPLWTEAVATKEHVEYMMFPRLDALCEVLWTPKNKLNLADLKSRLVKQLERCKFSEINFARSAFLVIPDATYNTEKDTMQIRLTSELEWGEILFTTDGSDPLTSGNRYTGPFEIKTNCILKTVQVVNKEPMTRTAEWEICVNKAAGTEIKMRQASNYPYSGRRNITLNDGMRASVNPDDCEWLGFRKDSLLEFTIDLRNSVEIDSLKTGFLQLPVRSVYLPCLYFHLPEFVEYFLSDDGTDFKPVTKVAAPKLNFTDSLKYDFPAGIKQKARFVKVVARKAKKLTEGFPENENTWLLSDEIIVK